MLKVMESRAVSLWPNLSKFTTCLYLNYACGAYVDIYGGKNGLFVSFRTFQSLSKEIDIGKRAKGLFT